MGDGDFWEDDYDNQPYADPQIRTAYEAALGRLILGHNEVDHRLTNALKRVTDRLVSDNSLAQFATGTFDTRLRNLELFQKAIPDSGAVCVDVAALRRLNKIRNDVAHGHFDQDPFDGSFTLIGDGKGSGKRAKDYSIADLNQAAEDLKSIATTLRAYEVFGDFPRRYLPGGAEQV
jgi:hypothetical protein